MKLLSGMVFLGALSCCHLTAGGLIQQLPVDGAWVSYDLAPNGKFPTPRPRPAVLTLSSVGRKIVKGEACRWIELKIIPKEGRTGDPPRFLKFLVPERFLVADQDPMDHILRMGEMSGNMPEIGHRKVVWTDKPSNVAYHMFLRGAQSDVVRDPAAMLVTPLGQMTCTLSEGTCEHPLSKVISLRGHYERHLNPKPPFGVAAMTLKVSILQNGEIAENHDWTFTLTAAGTNAISAFPDDADQPDPASQATGSPSSPTRTSR